MEESRFSILCMTLDMVRTNRYLIWNKDSRETLLIDPADGAAQIEKVIWERDLSLKVLLLTHRYFDHVLVAPTLRDAFQVLLCAVKAEAETLQDPGLNGDARWPRQGLPLRTDRLLHSKEKPSFLGTEIKVLFTLGHTAGFCCYYFLAERLLLSGDTLFEGPFGRVDLSGGNMASLERSLDYLLELPADTLVLSGHMGQTSIGGKRRSDPTFYY